MEKINDAEVLESIQKHLIIEQRFQVVFLIYLIVSYSIYFYFYKSQKLKTWHIITICGLIVIALFYQYWFFINRLRSYFIPIIALKPSRILSASASDFCFESAVAVT